MCRRPCRRRTTSWISDIGGSARSPGRAILPTGADRHAGFMQAMSARGLTPIPSIPLRRLSRGSRLPSRARSAAAGAADGILLVANNLTDRSDAHHPRGGPQLPGGYLGRLHGRFIWVNAFRPRLTTVSQARWRKWARKRSACSANGCRARPTIRRRRRHAADAPNVRKSCGPYRGWPGGVALLRRKSCLTCSRPTPSGSGDVHWRLGSCCIAAGGLVRRLRCVHIAIIRQLERIARRA